MKPTNNRALRDGEERRAYPFEFRAEGDDAPTIVGYGAVFDTLSENLGGFRETIRPGAFDDVLDNDVRALFNHNPDYILARSPGTLTLSVDTIGLRYEYESGQQSYARDLNESIARGDVTQSSFAFVVDEDRWEEDDDGRLVRTILKVRRLYDVSPVTYPGYTDTSVAARGLDQYNQGRLSTRSALEAEQRRRFLDQLTA